MDIKIIRGEIRRKYFSTYVLVIISILGIIGMLMIYFSGVFIIEDLNMLYECVSKNGIVIIFGVFFFCISLYCWGVFFLNIIISPKKEILYLCKNENNKIFFIDKKGKRYEYDIDKNNFEENNYYYVLKTHNYICKVFEKTSENWIPKEKKSYWLNCYSPMGNFEDIFLLPIVYVILFPCLLSFFMAKGYQKIYGVIFSIVPFYAIIYDLIYKIKLKQNNNKEIDETNFIKSYDIIKNSISIIAVIIMCTVLTNIFFSCSDFTSKLIFLPLYLCGLCSAGLIISKIFDSYILEKLFFKVYIVIFLIYWFVCISFFTIRIIKQEVNYIYALFSIPFWIAGLYAIYKYFIKNR